MSAPSRVFRQRLLGFLTLASVSFLATAHAQTAPDFIRQIDRSINSAIAQANQGHWERLPTTELICIDKALQAAGSSLSLVIPSLQPTDPKLAEIRALPDSQHFGAIRRLGSAPQTVCLWRGRPCARRKSQSPECGLRSVRLSRQQWISRVYLVSESQART